MNKETFGFFRFSCYDTIRTDEPGTKEVAEHNNSI